MARINYSEDHDFIRVRCRECERLFWTDGYALCPCNTCRRCGEPSEEDVCEECENAPTLCDNCEDEIPKGTSTCGECIEAQKRESA